ncbi:MAG: peptidase T [Caldiserica bacterium]|nr:peptidase T [Caldisericota bacterium]
MNNLVHRFLHYTSFDTQSDEHSVTFPSTGKQLVLAHELDTELQALGLKDSSVDANGYVTATLPANCESPEAVPVIAFLAHMDTSPDASGRGVKPRIVTAYDGKDISLNARQNLVLSPADFPDMLLHIGEDFIVADGTTLLGADDKAGIAEIMTAIEYLLAHPEVKHGVIKVGFTPDEEVGQGVDRFDVPKFGAKYAYTLDGDELGSLEYENFNAASAEFSIVGKSIHPGSAKGIMKNAALIAGELTTLFPSDETPRATEKREGFFHLTGINGMCEKAEVKYIIRDHDKLRFEQRKSMVHAITDFLNAKYGEETVTVHVRDSYHNMREIIEQNMVLIDTARGVMEKLGIKPLVKPVRGGTDGSRLSYMGLPCPNLFTGGRNYHGPLEYVVIQSMEEAVKVIVGIAEAFASPPPAAV